MTSPRHGLRQRRQQQGWTQEGIADAMRVAVSTYRSWENGTKMPRVGHRPRLADLLKVSLAQVDVFLDGERSATLNAQHVPTWLTLYSSLEQGASWIWAFEPMVVHGLLQTADYATAVERADAIPKSDAGVARRVETRLARQRVLTREPDPLRLSVIIDESVVMRPTGGREVMAEQLGHLEEMAQLPNVALHILPLDSGQFSSAFGAFTMIATQGATEPQIVCVEDRTGVRYIEGEHGVGAHAQLYDHLQQFTLPEGESADLVRVVRKGYES